MSKRVMLLMALVLVASLFIGSAVLAQSADTATWVSAITYYTNSTTSGTLVVSFYAEGSSTPINASPITLASHKAGSLFVGSVSGVPNGFKGSAVLSSDVPIFATNVEIAAAPNAGNYARALYNGFTANDAAATFYVPTVLRNKFNTNSIVGIQNIESFAATATLKFYAVGSTTPTTTVNRNISSQSSTIFKLADLGVPNGFDGSLVITAVRQGQPGTPARVVASAGERDISGRRNRAFEGVAAGGTKVYMASMLCNFGTTNQITNYAIQNTGGSAANVTATFYNTSGNVVGSMASQSVPAGGKLSTNPCLNGVPNGTSGSAVINSSQPIIVVGKVASSDGIGTAWNGSTSGSTTMVLPYVRWNDDFFAEYRTNIAVMNVGNANANVQLKYYDGNGTLKATQSLSNIPPNVKQNSEAKTAGAVTGGTFGYSPSGGAVEITSNQPVVVVVRAAKKANFGAGVITFGEDYVGIPATP